MLVPSKKSKFRAFWTIPEILVVLSDVSPFSYYSSWRYTTPIGYQEVWVLLTQIKGLHYYIIQKTH